MGNFLKMSSFYKWVVFFFCFPLYSLTIQIQPLLKLSMETSLKSVGLIDT